MTSLQEVVEVEPVSGTCGNCHDQHRNHCKIVRRKEYVKDLRICHAKIELQNNKGSRSYKTNIMQIYTWCHTQQQ